MNVLVFIITGFALFLLFRLLVWLSGRVVRSAVMRTGSKALLPVIELTAWIGYVFWGVHILFGGHLYYDIVITVMIVLLVFAVAWFVFRDFLAGVLLKAEKSLTPGQTIRTPLGGGRIKRLGSRAVELINEQGETVRIPYSRLSNELLILPPGDEESRPHHLRILLPATLSPDAAQEVITRKLLAMPWIIGPGPEVTTERTTEGYVAHITFHTHLDTQAAAVERRLREETEKEGKKQ